MHTAVVIANFVQACCWLVDQAPSAGETLRAHGFHSEPGGKGLNVAIALQRLGLQVTPILAHGQDAAGQALRELLYAEGLSPTHAHALPMPSGWGSGLIEPGGQNRIVVFPGANDHLSRAHVAAAHARIASANLVYGQFEAAPDAVDEAMRLAHRAGVHTVLNPSPWQALPGHLHETVRTYIVNEVEAEHLLGTTMPNVDTTSPSPLAPAGTTAPEPAPSLCCPLHVPSDLIAMRPAVQRFWLDHPGAQELVITLGAAGAVAWQRGAVGALFAPGLPAAPGGSTVGCGDAFSAGFCWARSQGESLLRALQAGNHCGARLASHPGVLPALPKQDWLVQALG